MNDKINFLLLRYEHGVLTEDDICQDVQPIVDGKISNHNLKKIIQYRLLDLLSLLLKYNCIDLSDDHKEKLYQRAREINSTFEFIFALND